MAGARPLQSDLLGMSRQKPIATVMPLAKAYEADKRCSAQAGRQAASLQDQVHRRTRERLDQAEARHLNMIVGMDEEGASKARADVAGSTKVAEEELSQTRESLQVKQVGEIDARQLAKEAALQSLDLQSHIEAVRSEEARHRAAMAVDQASARSQAMSAESQARVFENELMAKDQVVQLSKAADVMHGQVHCVLKDKLRESAVDLEAAHEHCQKVRRALANENAQFKRRMRQIELDAAESARSEERKVMTLEADRLSGFMQGEQSLQKTESRLHARRADCEDEIDEIHARLQQAEAASRQRADELLKAWVAGSEAAEQAVQQLELQGVKIMESMQSSVNTTLKAFMEKHACVQEQGCTDVVELERKANQVVDATQPTLEAARRDDEQAAAAATQKWWEARGMPEEITTKADDQIAARSISAREEEAELARQAEVRIAAARAAAKAAHAEEQRLQAESAEAWCRIRKACFELRLVNLHDLAQGIVAGGYDAQTLEASAAVES